VLSIRVTITWGFIGSVNGYCDIGRYMCSANSYCDKNG
jgi:hypothetical protein